MKHTLYGLYISLVFTSCLSHSFSLTSKQHSLPYDPKWRNELLANKDSLKDKWINLAVKSSYLKEHGLNFTKEELNALEYKPILSADIDYNTLKKFSGTLSEKDLRINTTMADYFVFKEGLLLIDIETKKVNGSLIPMSTAKVSDKLVETYSTLNQKERNSVFYVNVFCSDKDNYQRRYLVFYNKKGKLMNLTVYGTITPFEFELMMIKRNAESKIIW